MPVIELSQLILVLLEDLLIIVSFLTGLLKLLFEFIMLETVLLQLLCSNGFTIFPDFQQFLFYFRLLRLKHLLSEFFLVRNMQRLFHFILREKSIGFHTSDAIFLFLFFPFLMYLRVFFQILSHILLPVFQLIFFEQLLLSQIGLLPFFEISFVVSSEPVFNSVHFLQELLYSLGFFVLLIPISPFTKFHIILMDLLIFEL